MNSRSAHCRPDDQPRPKNVDPPFLSKVSSSLKRLGMCTTTPEPMNALQCGLIKPSNQFMPLTRRQRRTTGQEVEGISLLLALVALDDNGMTGIVPSGAPRTDVRLCREDIHELPFALVTPLGAEAVPSAVSPPS